MSLLIVLPCAVKNCLVIGAARVTAAILMGTISVRRSSNRLADLAAGTSRVAGQFPAPERIKTSRFAVGIALRIYLPVDKVRRRKVGGKLEGGRGGGIVTRHPKRETLWQRYLHCLQRLPDISAALSHDSTYQPPSAGGQRASPVCLRVSGCLADSFRLTGHFRHHMLQFPQGRPSKWVFVGGSFTQRGLVF